MIDDTPLLNWRRHLLAAAGCALLLALACALRSQATAHAQTQGTLSMEITKTLNGSPVVRVGQYLTFTIRITNTGTITIVQLPLIDEYDPAILRLDATTPPPSSASAGRITWTNLPTDVVPGPLLPGASITIVTRFRVIGITDRTINRAYVEDAVGEGGQSGERGSDESSGTTEGGRVVLEKALAPGAAPTSGQPLTFTISLRNDGAADIVKAPVQDTYSTEYLQFWRAFPPPSQVAPGELRWDDILPPLGLTRLRPNEIVTFTVVFTALKSVDGAVVNGAGATGVRDEFQNELPAPRRAEVPIRILPGPGEIAPTAQPTPKPQPQPQPTPTPVEGTPTAEAATAVPISTTVELPAPTSAAAGAVVVPARLPRTGGTQATSEWLLFGIVLIVCGALALLYRRLAR